MAAGKSNSDEATRGGRKTWKQHLLQSGVPLEYEVARMLAANDMAVQADFGFSRPDQEAMKDGSVDIYSTWHSVNNDDINFVLHILIECKYRSPHKSFLFLPDPNIEYPTGTLGGTTFVVDEFYEFHLSTSPFAEHEKAIPFAYKGIELFDGGAIEQELRHGVNQLRYAAPVMVARDIAFQTVGHADDRRPSFFAKILVTNARIRILQEECALSDIEAASDLDEIAHPVGCVILQSEYGPDYEPYVGQIFSRVLSLEEHARGLKEELETAGKDISMFSDPVELIRRLSEGTTYECRSIGNQFFVVSLEALPALLTELKGACEASFAGRKRDAAFKPFPAPLEPVEQIG